MGAGWKRLILLLERAFQSAALQPDEQPASECQAPEGGMADIARSLQDFDPEYHFEVPTLQRLGVLKNKPEANAIHQEPAHAANNGQTQRYPGRQPGSAMSSEQQGASASKDQQPRLPAGSHQLPQQKQHAQAFTQKYSSTSQQQAASPGLDASQRSAASDQQLRALQEQFAALDDIHRLQQAASMAASEADKDAKPEMVPADCKRTPVSSAANKEWAALEVAEAQLSPAFVAARFACLKKILANVRHLLAIWPNGTCMRQMEDHKRCCHHARNEYQPLPDNVQNL